MSLNKFLAFGSIGLCCALSCFAAEAPKVIATGLQAPSKIIGVGYGNYLVTETGTLPNSGQVSLVTLSGFHRVLLDGLPSGLAAPDYAPDGPDGIAWTGNSLYVTNGEGDGFVNGPRPGSIVPNPAGPSSPLFATLLKVTFCSNPDELSEAFKLTLEQQFTLADGKAVELTNSSGETATIELVTAFRTGRPDANTIYRNTHLYGITLAGGYPFASYIADAGNNAVWRVSSHSETPRIVARFPSTLNPIAPAGPPFSEAVPTSVHKVGSKLIVSLLAGAPFVPGTSRVVSVDLRTSAVEIVVDKLSSAIDVLVRRSSYSNRELFVLEYSVDLSSGAPGRLIRVTGHNRQVLADGLQTPSSMALDEECNSILITDRSGGKVLAVSLR